MSKNIKINGFFAVVSIFLQHLTKFEINITK